MPSVTFNSQSFAVDNRRIWIVGASLHYARVPPELWAHGLSVIRQGGFNTVESPCPWFMHEPRRGRYEFEGPADVRGFLTACGEAGLRTVLRVGPFIGSGYDGGGLPAWLAETPDLVPREASTPYLERVFRYLRKLAAEIADLQVTKGGPLLLVQAEHAWHCSHRQESERYLGEIVRILRESGIDVPITTANDLWTEVPGTIETWRGRDQMLSQVRQLRTVQSDAPRIVSGFEVARSVAWGDDAPDEPAPADALTAMAQILAAGGQPIVSNFHGGTCFGFTGGQLQGRSGATITTAAALTAPLREDLERTATYRAVRRLARFATEFGPVLADLDPDYQPVTIDPEEPGGSAAGSRTRSTGFSVVPLRGAQGRAIFIFAHGSARQTRLLLDNGLSMPIDLGDQAVGWFLLDADLQGIGRLDYANLCPVAVVARSMVIMCGAAVAPAVVSVAGTLLQETVPDKRTPLVVQHKGITFIIVNQAQADVTYDDGETVYVGIDGFDADGRPRRAAGYAKATTVTADGETASRSISSSGRKRPAPTFGDWTAAPAAPQCEGTSPRYASLDGPQTLSACGAAVGYGWYRMTLRVGSAAKKKVHLPGGSDRVHLFVDGEPTALVGVGPGAEPGPIELKLARGERTIVALVDNLGRFADGNDLLPHKGLYEHLFEVKPLKAAKPKRVTADPVNPFVSRGFIKGLAYGQLSDSEQAAWTFTHARKVPILVDIDGASASGTLVLNDVVIAYYAGASGAARLRLLLRPPELEAFKRGKNVLRFAPDLHQDDPLADVIKHTTLYECADEVTGSASWSFAKWARPADEEFEAPASKAAVRALRGRPCWWRATFGAGGAGRRLETSGLSKGQAYLNGRDLGRYFTARADGRAVGPQTSLHLPAPWLSDDEPNEVVIFDEHGFDPESVTLA